MKDYSAIYGQMKTEADNLISRCMYLCYVIPEDTACVAVGDNPHDLLRYLLRGKEIIPIGV